MADTFNLAVGQKAERKLFAVYVDVGTGTGSTYDWEILGRGVQDASLEFGHDIEQTTDILGISDTTVSDAQPTITFDPNTLRGGQKLSEKLLDIERRKAKGELSAFRVLVVYMFIGNTTSGFAADLQTGCTVVPQSIGGDDYVDMPIEVHLSGNTTAGTVTITGGEPTFTAAS